MKLNQVVSHKYTENKSIALTNTAYTQWQGLNFLRTEKVPTCLKFLCWTHWMKSWAFCSSLSDPPPLLCGDGQNSVGSCPYLFAQSFNMRLFCFGKVSLLYSPRSDFSHFPSTSRGLRVHSKSVGSPSPGIGKIVCRLHTEKRFRSRSQTDSVGESVVA